MAVAFTMLGASFTLILILMLLLWVIYYFQRNAGIVDIGWGLGFMLAAWAYFFLGHGNFLKMAIITAMATVWASRLTAHLYLRFRGDVEDPRYTALRQKWGGDSTNMLFLMLFIFQGVLVVIVSLPFFLVGFGSHPEWSWWELAGFVFWLAGVVGEGFADAQLRAFTKDPANQGQVCRSGLWRFSRHPNYFFETLVWIGFFMFALPSDGGALGIISPLIVVLMLVRGSGLPLTEAHSLQTKGEAYRDYQQTTSAFIPWFPKK